MQVDMTTTRLKDVEAWLIMEVRGDKRKRGSGSTISEGDQLVKQMDAGKIEIDTITNIL